MHVELVAKSSQYRRDMAAATTTTSRFRAEMTKTRSAIALFGGAAAFGVASKRIFDLGAAVEETGSKFRTVFGDSAKFVDDFNASFGVKAGLSNERIQAMTSSLGGLNQAMGASQIESAGFAVTATRLAADLASFHNAAGGTEEVLGAMKSALVGEFEPLKRFDILLNVATVNQEALAATGKTVVSQLTQQERATATLALITKRAGVAIGDLDRTQSSAANQAKQLGAEIQNLKEEMSTSLVPAFTVGISKTNEFIKGLQIMGVEAAVAVAKMELAFARLREGKGGGILGFLGLGEGAGLLDPLGLDLFSRSVGADLSKTVTAAEANLALMQAAADKLKLSIVGVSGAISGTGGGGAGGEGAGAAGGLVVGIRKVGRATFDMKGMMLPATVAVTAIGDGADAAAVQVDRLTEAMSKLNAATSLIGALGRIPGLGFLSSIASPLGIAGTILGAGKTLFPGAEAVAPVSSSVALNVNVPAASNPAAAARDQVWVRAVTDAIRVGQANGFRLAT